MKPHKTAAWFILAGLCVVAGVLFSLYISSGNAPPASAGIYWASTDPNAILSMGIQSKTPSVCFVGNAVMNRLDRVTQIVQYIKRFEYAANIKFISPISGRALDYELGPSGNVTNLICPTPTPQSNGNDYYSGDIRLALEGTNIDWRDPIPGKGCPTNDILNSDPDCVSRDSDHLDCFMRGKDNALWTKWWNSTDDWGKWTSMGGVITSGPTATSWGSNRLDVLARGLNNNLWRQYWTGTVWSGWADTGVSVASASSDPDCVSSGVNRLDCVVRWNDNTVRHTYWNGSSWSAWENLAGSVTSGPTVASWGVNRLDVTANGQDNALWHTYWNGSAWSGWESLGKPSGHNLNSDPDCVSWDANRIDCVVRGNDNAIWHTAWTGASWYGWGSLGGTHTTGPSIASRSTNLLDVFAGASNQTLWTKAYSGSQWNAWRAIGDNAVSPSYSSSPWVRNQSDSRSCLYNIRIGDNADPATGVPWLNHTLHEFGHALGLAHEFVRNDTDPSCGWNSSNTDGLITAAWDPQSVMNYRNADCSMTVNGNYDNTGLSPGDKLTLHIMYPEDSRVAELIGTTVIKQGDTLALQSLWEYMGANMNFVAHGYLWKIDGVTRSTTPDLNVAGLSAGDHTLEFSYTDFLTRTYSYTGKVTVLSSSTYTAEVASAPAVELLLLDPIIATVNLPIVVK